MWEDVDETSTGSQRRVHPRPGTAREDPDHRPGPRAPGQPVRGNGERAFGPSSQVVRPRLVQGLHSVNDRGTAWSKARQLSAQPCLSLTPMPAGPARGTDRPETLKERLRGQTHWVKTYTLTTPLPS